MKKIKLFGILMLFVFSVNCTFAETTISTFAEQDEQDNILSYNININADEDEGAAPLFATNEGTTTIYNEDDCTFSNININAEEDEATIHLYADNENTDIVSEEYAVCLYFDV